jgi:hypothetical protein
MAKVTRFPSTWYQRLKNRLGKHAVPCVYSERWLRFRPESTFFVETGDDYVTIDVMTGDPARKLCQMTVFRKDLLAALSRVKVVRAD